MVIKSIIRESRRLRTRVSSFAAATVIAGGSLVATTPLFLNQTAFAAPASTAVVVTPANTQGWSTADTRPGGAVNYVYDASSPLPNGALQFTTDATTTSKAQYLHAASTPLSQVTNLSYATKQVSGPAVADPSYQLITCLTGAPTATTCPGFTTLVFEPYQNTAQKAIVPNTWQSWDVSGTGLFWSTRTVTCSNGVITGTPGGPATYTLAAIKTACPSAAAAGFGVNIGSNNPGYNVETDVFNFNNTTYNFEINNLPTEKNQCKDNGFKNFTDANGNGFKNQGQCVSFVNGGGSSSKVRNTNNVTTTNNSSQSATSGNASSNGNTNGGSSNSGNASNGNTSTNAVVISNNPQF